MTMPASIRPVAPGDFVAIAAIYNHYVEHTTVSFEAAAVAAQDMAARGAEVHAASLPWLVAVDGDTLLGYAYAGKWKGRCAYRHSVESTVYLAPAHVGRGLGARLYGALFDILRSQDLRVVIGGVALPNERSVALHEKVGMRKVAHFEEVGFKFGRWIDVAYYQMRL